MGLRRSHLVVIFLGLSAHTQAVQAAGLDGLRAGWGAGGKYFFVSDPDGTTPSHTDVTYLNLIGVYDAQPDTRYFLQLFKDQYSLDATVTEIGQSVDRKGLNISYQWNTRLTRKWKPWVGIGVGVSKDEYSGRHLIDQDGFRVRNYPDYEDTSINVLLNTATEWNLSSSLNLGLLLQTSYSLNGSMTDATALFYLTYSFGGHQ